MLVANLISLYLSSSVCIGVLGVVFGFELTFGCFFLVGS